MMNLNKTKMLKPNAQYHNLDPSRQHEFYRNFQAGDYIAGQFLPRLMAGAITYEEATRVIDDRLHGSSEQQFAEMFLALPTILKSAKNENDSSVGILANSNAALKEIMLDAEGTDITRKQFVDGCLRFASTNLIVTSGNEMEKLEEALHSQVIGMWNEQSMINLLCAGNIINVDSTNSEDKMGIDIFAQASGKNEWVAIDVKASDAGIVRSVAKKQDALAGDFVYIQGYRQFSSNERPKAQQNKPAISLASTNNRVYAHLMVGPHSNNLAPMDFRDSPVQSTGTTFQNYIDSLAQSNFETYCQTTLDTGAVTFAPTKVLKKIAETATKAKA